MASSADAFINVALPASPHYMAAAVGAFGQQDRPANAVLRTHIQFRHAIDGGLNAFRVVTLRVGIQRFGHRRVGQRHAPLR